MPHNTPNPSEPNPAAEPPPFGQPEYGAAAPPSAPAQFADQPPYGMPPVAGPPGAGYGGVGPYGTPGPGYPSGPRPTESLAIVGLVLAICGVAVAAIPVSIVALRRIKRELTGGRGLAIAALVVSGFWLAFQLLFLGLMAWAVVSDVSSDPSVPTAAAATSVSGSRTLNGGVDTKNVKDLAIGDCLLNLGSGSVRTVTVVDCTQPHQAETLGEFEMPGSTYPVEDVIAAEAETQCQRFLPTTRPAGAPVMELYYFYPLESDWLLGNRTVMCLAATDGALVTGPVG